MPQVVRELAAGRPLRGVWRNDLGGLTFLVEGAGEYVKWSPEHWEIDLGREAEKSAWVSRWLPAPRVLAVGAGHDPVLGPGSWLHTRALPGTMAIAPEWQCEATLVELGRVLRRLHDTLPVRECAWSWRAEDRLATIAEHSPGADLAGVRDVPEDDLEVVCHGDACNPNFLMVAGPDGRPRGSGYVDLSNLGLADRWADLAPAVLSAGWNFAEVADADRRRSLLLEGYGIDLDADRLDYYTRLWQAGDPTSP
ncbi:phosphotransferase [Auraticoccus cholistanensis]|uniref:phosphotransferase n=1 Tax=Auraticoccus cholistanensis TaxID=2656650 RepID=UPI0018D213FD|nr:phosphotransferase [Auraticoccus cholistanensis]